MSPSPDNISETLIARESERCRCVVDEDFAALRDLLSPSLVHTHTRGNVDDRDSYLRYVRDVVQSLALHREGLRVIVLGPDAAVMHGKQINRARLRGREGPEVKVEAMVTQTWVREADGVWRVVAFQATPLGAPPPAVAR